jgi:hypothetical protein
VKRALDNGFSPPKLRSCHNSVPDRDEEDVIASIQHQAEKSQPTTRIDIRHYCVNKFGKCITRGWVDSFILRHSGELFETKSIPQENPRLQVPREFLVATVGGIEEEIQGSIRDLVFNLDEVSVSE